MRELKFRAWVKHLKKLSPVNELYFDGGAYVCDYEYALESDAIEVMQFTGLKDKNGVEIYEGDIVAKKGIDRNSNEYKEWMDNSDYSGDKDSILESKIPIVNVLIDAVSLDRFRYWLKDESFGYEGEDLEIPELFEVIGNIHENPELLK